MTATEQAVAIVTRFLEEDDERYRYFGTQGAVARSPKEASLKTRADEKPGWRP